MPRHWPPYPAEFRRQLVELVRSGRTPEELSREFEPSAQAIWNWVRQADRDGGGRRAGSLPSAEREELSRLRTGEVEMPCLGLLRGVMRPGQRTGWDELLPSRRRSSPALEWPLAGPRR